MFANIKITALLVGAGLLAATSFGSGVWVRDAFCDSAAAKVQLSLAASQIEQLKKNITARDFAEQANKDQSIKDREELMRLQSVIEEFKATDGVCFTDGDVNGLRKLWFK